ncbi:MAG TPA: histidine kinase [Puia sp.]|nr:histidine kinase [Puia sp.]
MKSLLDIKRFKFYAWVGLACFILGALVEAGQHPSEAGRRMLDNFWRAAYLTSVNYIFFEYTLPRLRWKKFLKSTLLILLTIFLYTQGFLLWRLIGIRLRIYTPFLQSPGETFDFSDAMGYSMSSIFFFGIARHIYNHIKLKQKAQQLLIEKQQAELNYLKSQTNPHFLFNTLNNIYSLARDKSDRTPETILRLSKILRYMLYEAGGSYIAIEQELKIIGDYISLEKLRYDDSLRINFNYDVEDMKQALPPLLLIPLVENAFKHGASETRNQPFVDIHLSVVKRQLAFFVRNSTEEFSGDSKVKENIGLSNLRRQLELLYTDYNISLEQRVSEFSATLKINLASHV